MVLYPCALYILEQSFDIYLFGKHWVHACQASMVWQEWVGQQNILF